MLAWAQCHSDKKVGGVVFSWLEICAHLWEVVGSAPLSNPITTEP